MSEKLCTSSPSSNSSDSEDSCSLMSTMKLLGEKTAACGEQGGAGTAVDGASGGASTAGQGGGNALSPAGLAEGLDRLLAQQRCDLMTELRKLQHGHRPVTNTDSRETLEEFFSSASQPDGAPARPAASRPESVQSEVQGLAERRPVTSVLSTQSFRRNLEGVIRGTLVRQDRELQQAMRLQAAGFGSSRSGSSSGTSWAAPPAAPPAVSTADALQQHMESLSQLSHSSSGSHTGLADLFAPPQAPPQAPPLPSPGQPMMPSQPWQQPQQQQQWQQQQQPWQQQQQQPWQQQQQPWQQQQQQPWQQQQQQQQPWQQQQQQQPWQQQQQPWQQSMQSQPPVLPQQPWLVQNRGAQQQANSGVNMVAYLQHVHREETVFEISDLIQRQVVSSALNGNFRDTLENTMLGRLQSMDTDGLRVQNFVQSLQQSTQHQRNDFSHLGIAAPAPGQQSAAARGSANGMQAGPEMERMRQQMEEMKTMLRLTFELQMDMQRSIRQEVSAALAGRAQTGTPDVSTATPPPPVSQPASEGQCIICLERSVDAVLYQCGHMCCCLSCGLRLRSMGAHCPMCRAPIRDVIRAYRCQRD